MADRTEISTSGWRFPARTTAYFLVVAALSLGSLALLGLTQVRGINAENTSIRVDRAGRTAVALVGERVEGAQIVLDNDGSPQSIAVDQSHLEPAESWDALLDTIGGINEGAANLFRLDPTTQSFDRLSTTFRTPEGQRVGGSDVELGLISVGHPAFESIMAGTPFVGQVPVNGRLRLAYLTPINDEGGNVAGILAVDVGWVDDLERINHETSDRALLLTSLLVVIVGIIGVLVMFLAFRPLHRLTLVAHALGSAAGAGDGPIELTSRRDEIGYLAKGLAKVAELQKTLEHHAYNDSLTKIPNRAALMRELERRYLDVDAGPFALMIVDLDGFKKVNDGLGHQAGDELLCAVAAGLSSALDPGEFVARLGGDEFAILSAVDVEIAHSYGSLAERVAGHASGVFKTAAGDARVTASVGVALVPVHGKTCEQAMTNADLALYKVKRTRPGAIRLYDTSLSDLFERQLYLISELRHALEQEELELAYQPIYDMSGRMVGLEGLARWNHQTEGSIAPAEFIPIAEGAGLIDELGSWALHEACRQIHHWSAHHNAVPTVAINVSTLQLRHPDFVEKVAVLLERYPAARGRLSLEITESVVVSDESGWHREVLARLSDLDVSIAIDDFGTGYSALSYLHDLEVDKVKIDRSFVVAAAKSACHLKLLQGIVGLAKGVGLEVVVEGVETAEDYVMVGGLSCDTLQGFYLALPMSPEAVASLFDVVHSSFTPPLSMAA